MLQLALTSLWRPRASAAVVLNTAVSDAVLYRAALLLACINGLIVPITDALLVGDAAQGNQTGPFSAALVQFLTIFLTAMAAYQGGRMFSGTGDFNNSLKIAVWYGVVSILPSLVIAVLFASGNETGLLLMFVVVAWMMFVLSSFIMQLHGFGSLFLTSLGVIGASIVIGMGMYAVLIALGLVSVEPV